MINFRQTHLIILLLIAAPLIIFFQTTNHDFVWDDDFILDHGKYLQKITIDNLLHLWAKPYNELYIPVSLTAWLLINQIAHFNPRPFHVINIIFHISNGLLLFLILQQLIKHTWTNGDFCGGNLFLWIAGAGAMLFAIHPIQVEVVAFAWGFKDILSLFFALIAIWLYINYVNQNKRLFYMLATIAFILSILAKPATVVLPILIWILKTKLVVHSKSTSQISEKLETIFRSLIRDPIIFWVLLALPVMIITKLAQPPAVIHFTPPIWARPFIFADAINFYLFKLVYPLKLCAAYGHTPQWIMNQPLWLYTSWLIPVGITILLWKFRRTLPLVWVGWLFFVVGLLPVSGLIPFEYQNWSTTADRYLYLPMVGVSFMFIGVVEWLIGKKQKDFSTPLEMTRGIDKLFFTIIIALFIFWGIFSFHQTNHWQNRIRLWSDVINKYPQRIVYPYNNRGIAYADDNQYELAINDFNQAIQIKPDHAAAYSNRGQVYLKMQMNERAFRDFNQALQIKPNDANAHYYRGYIYQQWGKINDALENYQLALKFDPGHAPAYNNRGIIYQSQNKFHQAIADYTQAIKLDSGYIKAYNNRGNAYALLGRYEDALIDYNHALHLDPNAGQVYRDRAISYFYIGRYEQAWADVHKAQVLGVQIHPQFLENLKKISGERR